MSRWSRAKKRKYSAGLGYGTDTGFRGKLRVERRWLNPQAPPLRSRNWGIPQIKSLIAFKYMIPAPTRPPTNTPSPPAMSRQNDNDKITKTTRSAGSLQQQDGKWLKTTV